MDAYSVLMRCIVKVRNEKDAQVLIRKLDEFLYNSEEIASILRKEAKFWVSLPIKENSKEG